MAENKTTKNKTSKPQASSGFTAAERAAMRARAKEAKAQATKEQAEAAVLEAIAEMADSDRTIAERLHNLIKEAAPSLDAKTWYGMPAYAKDGRVVCYFKGGHKFQARYAVFGFEDAAALDDGAMWPTCFALTEVTGTVETKIRALVKKAVG